MNRFALTAAAAALAVALPTTASAEAKKNSATLGVAKLAWPAVGLEYERRLLKKVGVSGYAGIGRFNPLIFKVAGSDNPFATGAFNYNEVGARLNLYAIGKFKHGMNLGLTLQNRGLIVTDNGNSASVRSTTVGPHIGYKLILKPGFTMGFLGGVGYNKFGDMKTDVAADQQTLDEFNADIQSLPNVMTFGTINAGWSF